MEGISSSTFRSFSWLLGLNRWVFLFLAIATLALGGYKGFSDQEKKFAPLLSWARSLMVKEPSPMRDVPALSKLAMTPLPMKAKETGNTEPFSPAKLKVLQDLSRRHDEIVLKEKELASKETVLSAVEARLDAKLDDLKSLREEISETLTHENTYHQERLTRLQNAYEKMPPKDAARIMQDLPLDLVLSLLEKMPAASTSAILSKMDPESARVITERLGTGPSLP